MIQSVSGGSDGKASAHNTGDLGSIPRWGRSPGEGNGNPLQYSCLENSMDGGAWWATVHRVAKSWTRFHFHFLSAWMHRLPSCSRQQEAEMSTARSVTAREPEARWLSRGCRWGSSRQWVDSRTEASSGVCYTELPSSEEWKPILHDLKGKFGEGDGTQLQYCCLENPMDRGAW